MIYCLVHFQDLAWTHLEKGLSKNVQSKISESDLNDIYLETLNSLYGPL